MHMGKVKQHIMEVAPKSAVSKKDWSPSRKQLSSFSKTMRAVSHGPDGVFDDIGDGYLDRESWQYMLMADPEAAQWLQMVAMSVAQSGLASVEQLALIAIIQADTSESSDTFSRVMRLQDLYSTEKEQSKSGAQMNFPEQSQTTMQGVEARSAAA